MQMVSPVSPPAPSWQHALANAFLRPAELLDYLELPRNHPDLALSPQRTFGLRVPRGFAARMQKGNPHDPLLRQVWPSPQEDTPTPGFVSDAVGDMATLKDHGLLHKYQGRALVIVTGACAVHCRYCFRRHFPYSEARASSTQWQPLLAQIAADPSLSEIILSGGDPLSLTDEKLLPLIEGLAAIPHLQRLRIHTRTAVVLPERITPALVAALSGTRLTPVVVVHVNHANELDAAFAQAVATLRTAGITVLNQAVLLKGVNDNLAALTALSSQLFAIGILPYYLHLLDKVQGAAHFEVTEDQALALYRALATVLPGYLVPRLAREDAGAPSKTWMSL